MKNLYPTIVVLSIFLVSCGQRSEKMREYDDVSIPSPLLGLPKDDFAKNHPFLDKQNASDKGMPMAMPTDPETAKMLNASRADVKLTWKTPTGWSEEPGNGMRIVTFKTPAPNSECSIVSLGGMAGGFESNVARWVKQIGIDVDQDEIATFIKSQEKIKTAQNLEMTVLNFTDLQKDLGSETPSMLATIIENKDKTIFIKFTGTKQGAKEQLKAFKSLLQSISIGP